MNALSTWLRAEISRDGAVYVQEYERGKARAPVKKSGTSKHTGTKVSFEPDSTIFQKIDFDLKRILDHLRQQAFLTQGVRIGVVDRRAERPVFYGFYFDGGLHSFIQYLVGGNAPIQDALF